MPMIEVEMQGREMSNKARQKRGFIRFSKAKARRICDLVSKGTSLKAIARLGSMPSVASIYKWRKAHPDFDIAMKEALAQSRTKSRCISKPASEHSPKGRISDYSDSIAGAICERLSAAESLRSICEDEVMPTRKTVYSWLKTHPEFQLAYETARSFAVDSLVDEMLEIADDARNDWIERITRNETTLAFNAESVQRSRLRIQTRQWIAEKHCPSRYGQKIKSEVTGKDGGVLQAEVTGLDTHGEKMSELEIARRVAFLLQKGAQAHDWLSNQK
ncbi:hypothetical protein [Pseudovibrio brasiliensis]|uniref:Terminase small subunit protein n=1 Tax=Pseudovibrio brasiliensis TaxID=1898042 RepID=A0ABX8ALK0_9HYPH|nr:hypothetical protein [Pseudovibrio brasiliensis]QUS55957.1 hypothetical protein KGB56_00255 [Pseudovibrio brasiliensis]